MKIDDSGKATMEEESRCTNDVEADIERLRMEIQMEQEKLRHDAVYRSIMQNLRTPACIPFTPGQILDKDQEHKRLEALREGMIEAEKLLDESKWWDAFEYRQKMLELKKAIDGPYLSEHEKKETLREALYCNVASSVMVLSFILSIVTGLLGGLHLIICIRDGIASFPGTILWISVTFGLFMTSGIAQAVAETLSPKK